MARGLWTPRPSRRARLAPPAHGHTGSLDEPRGHCRWVTVQLESASVARRRRHRLRLAFGVTCSFTRAVLARTQAHPPLTQAFVSVRVCRCVLTRVDALYLDASRSAHTHGIHTQLYVQS